MRREEYADTLTQIALSGVALGLLSLVSFFLGSLGLIQCAACCVFLAIAQTAVACRAGFLFSRQLSSADRAERILLGLFLAIAALVLAYGFLPPASRDELIHHLAIPRLYARAGEIIELPFARYSYYPMLADMLYVPWLALGIESGPKLIHALYGLLTAFLIFNYLSYRVERKLGILGAIIFLTTPVVFRLSTLAYVDLTLTFYSTCALFCVLHWGEAISRKYFLVLAGVSSAFMCAAKPNGALLAAMLCLAVLSVSDRAQGKTKTATLQALALFGCLTCVAVIPWLVRNFAWTGNPFFPFFRDYFGAAAGALDVREPIIAVGALTKRVMMYGESIWEVLLLPLRIFFYGEDDNPRYFDGKLNPILVFFLPFAFSRKFLNEKLVLLVFAVTYLFTSMILTDARVRYALPAVPFFTVLAVFGIHRLSVARRFVPAILVGVVGLLSLNFVYILDYSRRVFIIEWYAGAFTRQQYLIRMLPDFKATQFLNGSTKDNTRAKAYLIFTGRKGYYIEPQYTHDDGELPMLLLDGLKRSGTTGELLQVFESRGITHILARTDLLARFLGENLDPAKAALWQKFTSEVLMTDFQDGPYAVLRFRTAVK